MVIQLIFTFSSLFGQNLLCSKSLPCVLFGKLNTGLDIHHHWLDHHHTNSILTFALNLAPPTHRVSVSSDIRHESSAASTSDSNIPPQCNPDRHLTSDQAVDDSDHASLLVREQVTNNGEHAHTSTSDHTAIPGEHATSLTVNHVESLDYEHNSKGIKANIYTAHFTLNHTSSSPTSQLSPRGSVVHMKESLALTQSCK
jgi:hypothetical protein